MSLLAVLTVLLLCLVLPETRVWSQPIIKTVAGTGYTTYLGDGIPATLANLDRPKGVAYDKTHSVLYVANTYAHRVHKIVNGTLWNVAGNGSALYAGDNGPSQASCLSLPYDVTLDSHGALYIADSENGRVRRVDALTGVITTYAGGGAQSGPGGNGMLATDYWLIAPQGITMDHADVLYLADALRHSIYSVTPNGVITRIAGTGIAGLSSANGLIGVLTDLFLPTGITIDRTSLDVYFTEPLRCFVRRMRHNDSIIERVVGTGRGDFGGDGLLAVNAFLNIPEDVAFDDDNRVLYVADQANQRVRAVDMRTGIIRTVAGTAGLGYNGDNIDPTTAELFSPSGVAVGWPASAQSFYIADSANDRVRWVYTVPNVTTTTPPPTPIVTDDSGKRTTAIVATFSVLMVLTLVGALLFYFRTRSTFLRNALMLTRKNDATARGIVDISADDVILRDVIAEGYASLVYRARFRGADIAVKVLKDQSPTPGNMARFFNEHQINVSVASSPRVITYLGSCKQAGRLYLAFELMPHGSLRDFLNRDKNLWVDAPSTLAPGENANEAQLTSLRNLRKVTQMLVDAASGLQHCHALGILHRDIAARNFLVDTFFRVTLCDFGLSTALPAGTEEMKLPPGAEELPIKWTSPETLRHGTHSSKSDVYSFGIFLWEAMSRSDPYPGMNTWEVAPGVCEQKQTPLRPTVGESIPRALVALMQRCWDADPTRRPTAQDVLKALQLYHSQCETADSLQEAFDLIPDVVSTSPLLGDGMARSEVGVYDKYKRASVSVSVVAVAVEGGVAEGAAAGGVPRVVVAAPLSTGGASLSLKRSADVPRLPAPRDAAEEQLELDLSAMDTLALDGLVAAAAAGAAARPAAAAADDGNGDGDEEGGGGARRGAPVSSSSSASRRSSASSAAYVASKPHEKVIDLTTFSSSTS